MFLLNRMFWNETEHVHLQAEVCILETRVSLGFIDSQWETSLKFTLELNLDSEWLVPPMPCGWCSWVGLPGLCFVSRQERQEEGEKIAWCFAKLKKSGFETTCADDFCVFKGKVSEEEQSCVTEPQQRRQRRNFYYCFGTGFWNSSPKRASLSKEWEESASMTSNMCGFKNPPPWCAFISMSCSISKTYSKLAAFGLETARPKQA